MTAYKSFAIVLTLSSSTLFAQNWYSVGRGFDKVAGVFFTDTTNNTLYIGGNFKFHYDIDTTYTVGIAAFDGDTVYAVGCGVDWNCITPLSPNLSINGINSICKFNEDIIAGGSFLLAGGKQIKRTAKWDGADWDSLAKSPNAYVWKLYSTNNLLFVGGAFDSIGNIKANGIAKWDGNTWTDIGNFANNFCCGEKNTIRAICFYKDELYLGGNIADSIGVNIRLARYDGALWKNLGSGIKGGFATVNDFEVYQGYLYVAGMFNKNDGNPDNSIARWDGEQWHSVGGGVSVSGSGSAQIFDLHIFNGELYAVGQFNYAGGAPAKNIAKWDGQQWCGLGSQFDNTIFGIGIYNNDLYIGGGFWTIDGDTILRIAKWTGGDYVDTCGAINGVEEFGVREFGSLEVFPNPAQTEITLWFHSDEHEQATLSLYDISGKTVSVQSVALKRGKNTLQINIAGLSPGFYTIQLISKEKSSVKKFVKK